MLDRSSISAPSLLVLALLAVAGGASGCGGDKASASPGDSASAAASAAPPTAAAGFRLKTTDEVHETPTGKLPDELFVDGPAAALISDSPVPTGPKKWLSLYVFPKGTDPSTICDSDFPGPKKKDEVVLGLDAQFDGELRVGPQFSDNLPSIMHVSKDDDGDITAAKVGKPNLVDITITAVTADSVSVVAKARPGAPFQLEASFTAKICKK